MIYSNNSTSLGNEQFPMAEGYDCYAGPALALIESAQNDLAMFTAMIKTDFREAELKLSGEAVSESTIEAISEASIKNIWETVKTIFAKLLEKLAAIKDSAVRKIMALGAADKGFGAAAKAIKSEEAGNKEVTFAPLNSGKHQPEDDIDSILSPFKDASVSDLISKGDFTVNDHLGVEEGGSLNLIKEYYGESKTVKFSETGLSVNEVVSYITNFKSVARSLDKAITGVLKTVKTLVRDTEKKAKNVEKRVNSTGEDKESGTNNAQKVVASARTYQTAVVKCTNEVFKLVMYKYKMYKSILIKLIKKAPKNESAAEIEYNEYIDMVAEAACQEVEDVIQGAISDEELSQICAASKNVKDEDVSDDPSKLTYGQDCYTPDRSNVKADGSIDTEINSKHESVDYGELFY